MSNLDPFDVLGISHNSSWDDIKKAYKQMLIKTHPDKMNGSAKYFMLVHEAFNDIQKQFKGKSKMSNAPKEKMEYKNYVKGDVQPPKKMKNMSKEKFNHYFDSNRINEHNPFSTSGYRSHMADRLNYQEDLSLAKSNKVFIPTNQITKYQEPESLLSSKILESVYHLGVESVDDFSGGGGTDIMKAYCHNNGEIIDTVKRYKNIDEIQNDRSNQNMTLTKEELLKQKQLEKHKLKLEQYRLRNIRNNDANISNKYTQLHQRLQ
jgi:curved DNA-binding protein CbpA